MKKKSQSIIIALSLLTILILPTILSQLGENEEIKALGFDLEELLSFVNGIIALILFLIAFIAYRVDGRKRILFVSIAFLLFSIKSFLDSSELFGTEIESLGAIAVILEFLVLMVFFFGVVKKGA
jgi:hypothetical protein